MEYDKQILKILVEAGEAGLSVQKISRHVFNACNSLFNSIDYADVHDYVLQYLQRNSKNPNSIITRADSRGIYRINPVSDDGQQLILQFSNTPVEEEPKPTEDLSLSLFD